MALSAGDLWIRVKIEQPTTAPNEVGEPVLTWTEYKTVWADVSSLSSRESERYAETVGYMTHRVRIRYLDGLTSAMRVVYRDRVLEIGQILERERLWHQEIICTERRAS